MNGLERGKVKLALYRPEWKQQYEAEVERLEAVAGNSLHEVEHIGSIAIKGMAAKPIIDLLAVVDDVDETGELIDILETNGYEYRPAGDVRDRRFLAKGPRTNRTHYLSLCERESTFYREKLAFRDYLRTHPDVAAEYETLKRDLAEQYPDDRATYTERKGEFIEEVLERALADWYEFFR